ncbi:hypothetical protein cypCar_00044650 [Cyprinus carpio]|nr:hypothetical protein cypCar_00044650 [Cyprinus carpio]
MMDLRVSVVLLLIFLTGGYSLKCYVCNTLLTDYCEAKVELCRDGFSKCQSQATEISMGFAEILSITRNCASTCEAGTEHSWAGETVTQCCDTDLCNAADTCRSLDLSINIDTLMLMIPELLKVQRAAGITIHRHARPMAQYSQAIFRPSDGSVW